LKTRIFKLLLVALAALACASPGWGYVYILNDQVPAPNGTGLPIKWPPGTIPMRIYADDAITLLDGSTAAGSIRASLDSWNALLGDAQFTYVTNPGGTPSDGSPHLNEVSFAGTVYGKAFDTNVLAVTTVWFSGNKRIEADTIFNTSKYTWNSYRDSRTNHPSATIDIQRVAIHEFGHTLGLDHPDAPQAPQAVQYVSAIMNSHISDIAAQTADDIAGAQSIYGPGPLGTVPPNDNFANAITITLANNAATMTGHNNNATKESGEPNHAGDQGGRSVWWKWSAPVDGPVSLDTAGSIFDTTLGVYTGASVSNLTAIASSDDVNPGVVQYSALTFSAVGGTTYYIAVDGFNSTAYPGADRGGITLNLTFTPSSTPPTVLAQLHTADFNGDGKADILWSNTSTGDRYVWLMNGGTVTASIFLGTLATAWTPATGDFNGDGKADILWSNTLTGDRYLWLMNSGTVTASIFLGTVPTQWTPATGDFNGDGKADILWSNTSTGDRYLWLMNGGTVTASIFLGTVATQWSAAIGDANGDGKADLLWSNTATGDRYGWLMNGGTVTASTFIATISTQWTPATGDFNGDGKADILWSNTATGDRYIWLLNGSTLTSSIFIGTVGTQWIPAIGDFNGDGKADMLWSNTATGDRYIWLMNGGTVTTSIFIGNVGIVWQLSN
jgi:hypothetical protein